MSSLKPWFDYLRECFIARYPRSLRTLTQNYKTLTRNAISEQEILGKYFKYRLCKNNSKR